MLCKLLFHIYIKLNPGVDEKSRAVQLNTGATLSCIVNGLTQSLDAVVWKKDNVDVTTLSDYSTNYVLTKGSVVGNSQATTLKVIDAGLTDTDYVCVVTSDEHGETNKERNVKLETFGEFLFHILKFVHSYIIHNFILYFNRLLRSFVLFIVNGIFSSKDARIKLQF